MKIILLSSLCHRSGSKSLSLPKLGACVGVVMSLALGGSLWAGYELGRSQAVAAPVEEDRAEVTLREVLDQQRRELNATRVETRQHLDALALRLGEMQSHILRLDALGERLAEIGQLDAEEFAFGEAPARGGIESAEGLRSVELDDLVDDMAQLQQLLDDREHKLDLMEGLITNSQLQADMTPAGRPVKKGWVSSRYGYRKDPFSGKKAFHHGVDIAGKKDSDVFAVASGIVTVAKKKAGFGYLVELQHADGYITRYGHNSKILVKQGDLVEKGQKIGLMGSTGRSTGPHVHFEIARNGKSINPSKYLRKSN